MRLSDQKGFASFVILIIIATLIVSVGYLTLGKKFELVGPSTTTFYGPVSSTNTPTPSPSPQPKPITTKQTGSGQAKLVKFICNGGWTKQEFKYDPNTGKSRSIHVYISVDGKYYKQEWEDVGTDYYDSQGRLCVQEGPGVWESEQYSFCLKSAKSLSYSQENLCKIN